MGKCFWAEIAYIILSINNKLFVTFEIGCLNENSLFEIRNERNQLVEWITDILHFMIFVFPSLEKAVYANAVVMTLEAEEICFFIWMNFTLHTTNRNKRLLIGRYETLWKRLISPLTLEVSIGASLSDDIIVRDDAVVIVVALSHLSILECIQVADAAVTPTK